MSLVLHILAMVYLSYLMTTFIAGIIILDNKMFKEALVKGMIRTLLVMLSMYILLG